MTVAYLCSEYPRVSHSFIRREIRALEAHGVAVERFSIPTMLHQAAAVAVAHAAAGRSLPVGFTTGSGCARDRPPHYLEAVLLPLRKHCRGAERAKVQSGG